MAESFDEKFADTIKEMKSYLVNDKLSSISFTFEDGWTFKLSIPKKKWEKLV